MRSLFHMQTTVRSKTVVKYPIDFRISTVNLAHESLGYETLVTLEPPWQKDELEIDGKTHILSKRFAEISHAHFCVKYATAGISPEDIGSQNFFNTNLWDPIAERRKTEIYSARSKVQKQKASQYLN